MISTPTSTCNTGGILVQANESVAERYLIAVLGTLQLLAAQPEVGRRRKFRHPALRDIRSFRLVSPFGVHLIFYRHSASELFAERLMVRRKGFAAQVS